MVRAPNLLRAVQLPLAPGTHATLHAQPNTSPRTTRGSSERHASPLRAPPGQCARSCAAQSRCGPLLSDGPVGWVTTSSLPGLPGCGPVGRRSARRSSVCPYCWAGRFRAPRSRRMRSGCTRWHWPPSSAPSPAGTPVRAAREPVARLQRETLARAALRARAALECRPDRCQVVCRRDQI